MDFDYGTRLYEQMVGAMRQMHLSSDELGRSIYQLAGFCARIGQHTRAIEALAEAMRLQPWATEWAKQDHALDTLRDLPAFQAPSAIS